MMVRMDGLPRFTRAQVLAAFDALGLSGREDIGSLLVKGTEIEVGVFVFDSEGEPVTYLDEPALAYVVVPVEEEV